MFLYLDYGSSYVAFKSSFEDLPPLLSSGALFSVAGAFLVAVAVARGARLRDVTDVQLRSAVTLGLLMIGIGTGAVMLALQHLDSGTTALIQASIPMWIALGDRVVFNTRLPVRVVAGLAVGFVGIVGLVGGDAASIPPVWFGFVMVGSMAWAGGVLAARVLPQTDDWFLGVGLQMGLGGPMLVAIGLVHGDLTRVHSVGAKAAGAWVFLLVFTAVIGFNLFMWLARTATPTLVGTTNYVDPIVALLAGWVVLGEHLTARSGAAAAVILAGVVLIASAASGASRGRGPDLLTDAVGERYAAEQHATDEHEHR